MPLFAPLLLASFVAIIDAHVPYVPLPVKGSLPLGTFPNMTGGGLAACREGHAVTGFRLASERSEGGGDDTALNWIRFYCSDGSLIHSVGGEGDWGKPPYGYEGPDQFCPGKAKAVGMEILVEDDPAITDKSGVNNIRLHCTRGKKDYVEGKETRSWGTWRGMTDCAEGHRLCGFQPFRQLDQGNKYDDLAITGITILCCPDPKD